MAPIARTTSLGQVILASRKQAASLTTALTGTNNDLTYTSDAIDATGNAITVRYVVAGNDTALSVSVTGSAITVNVATDSGGAATSTAAQVRDAVNAHGTAGGLVTAANAAANDGTGVVTALAATPLAGGITRKTAKSTGGITRVKQAKRGILSPL